MLPGRKPQIKAYKRKNITLLVTPEGKKLIPHVKNLPAGKPPRFIHKNLVVWGRRELSTGIGLSHLHEFYSAVKQSAISEHTPRPYALLREKNRIYFYNERVLGKEWQDFTFKNGNEKRQMKSAIFSEAEKLAKNGLLPFDFAERNILLNRTAKGIDFHFKDTSIKPPGVYALNDYLKRAELPTLLPNMPIRKAQRWYLRLPLRTRIKIQMQIIKWRYGEWGE